MDKYIIKKDGTRQLWNPKKVIDAINKSAERVNVTIEKYQQERILELVEEKTYNSITVEEVHVLVEQALEEILPRVARSYREFRNYKTSFQSMINSIIQKKSELDYRGDNTNANTDSSFVSTKRSLTYAELNKQLYKKFFLNTEELRAIHEGTIYVHDIGSRNDTFNCCLFDFETVLEGGFEMGNLWYNEPKSFIVAAEVLTDLMISVSAQQYGK